MDNSILLRIERILILQTSSPANIGLLNGKMGIALFFYNYFAFSSNSLYQKFADELIDEVYDAISMDSPLNFSDGLSGVAWGIEYLIQNKFVVGDRDFLLEDLDLQIVKWDVRKEKDMSLNFGLKGLAHYVLSRYNQREQPHPIISKQYVSELFTSIQKNAEYEDSNVSFILQQLMRILKGEKVGYDFDDFLFGLFADYKCNVNSIFSKKYSLGLAGGYAGLGLKIIKK